MLENAVYSAISPEGCASILWKDSGKVREASDSLHMCPEDLLELCIIEHILPESDTEALWHALTFQLDQKFTELLQLSAQERCEVRYRRFRKIGVFGE